MEVLVAHHGHCFDGAASAAVFTRFYRDVVEKNARFYFRGLNYEPGAPNPGSLLDPARTNVILDFRYAPTPLLHWYFDHHVSAFQEAGSETHFRADTSGKKFHNGAYGSCTKLLTDVGLERFGWSAPELAELVRYADLIDAARYADADEACSLEPPAQQLTAVLQEHGDDGLCAALIPLLAEKSLAEIAAMPLIAERLAPLRARTDALRDRMERAAEQRGDVGVFDLSEAPLEAVAKFVAYKLLPTARYSVVLSWTPKRAKISVGVNPWSKRPRKHNIARLCERYGGGGHPVVGAVSLPGGELPRARTIVEEMIAALNGPGDEA